MSAHGIREHRSAACDGALLEHLEPRIVLAAADLAFVGLDFDGAGGYQPFVEELVWAADRSVTGNRFEPGPGGPADPVPVEAFDLVNGPGGMARFLRAGEPWSPETRNGSRFTAADDYPAGWLSLGSDDTPNAPRSFGALIERSRDAMAGDLVGTWIVQFTQVIGDQIYTRAGTLSLSSAGGFFALARGSAGDPIFAGQGFEFTGDAENGRLPIRMANGDTGLLYTNADESVIAFADLDQGDTDAWMGVGVRQGVDLEAEDLAGSYRAGVLFESDRISGELGGDVAAEWRIDLDDDGTFEAFDLASIDRDAAATPELSGAWVASSGSVTLTDDETGFEITLSISDNTATGIVTGVRTADLLAPERPMGLVTRIADAPSAGIETSVFSGVFDADGAPVLYDLRQPDDSWSVVDLSRFALPDPAFPDSAVGEMPIDIEAFKASDGRLLAVVATPETLLGFDRDDEGFWRTTDLTRSIDSAEPIASSLTVFTDRPGVAYVAGLTETGDVVTYRFDPAAGDAGEWSYDNVSQTHLVPRGQETPVFVGPIISFVTPWNALNIAGLDAEGKVQAVWTGNGGIEWNASDLSAITGAPALASGLTAFTTSWNAINIVGLDTAGNVLATWWVPSFGGNWAVSDLTAIAGGPALTGATVTSFVAPWGALNITGLDADGDMIAYWWTPALQQAGEPWQVANLTASFSPDDPRPAQQLQGQTNLTYGGELNILGADAESGDLLRLFFRVEDDAWAVENVTETAAFG